MREEEKRMREAQTGKGREWDTLQNEGRTRVVARVEAGRGGVQRTALKQTCLVTPFGPWVVDTHVGNCLLRKWVHLGSATTAFSTVTLWSREGPLLERSLPRGTCEEISLTVEVAVAWTSFLWGAENWAESHRALGLEGPHHGKQSQAHDLLLGLTSSTICLTFFCWQCTMSSRCRIRSRRLADASSSCWYLTQRGERATESYTKAATPAQKVTSSKEYCQEQERELQNALF